MSTEGKIKKLDLMHWYTERRHRVLLVDDEMRIAQEVQDMLINDGIEVQIAPNGKSALEMLPKFQPDVVLTETVIRYVNGFELCRQIKENKATQNIPVIIVTGLSRPADKIRGIEAGANDFVTKPFDAMELKTRVRSAIRMKELNANLEDFDEVILAFSRAVEARDPYTRGHSERVGKYSIKLGVALGVPKGFQDILYKGAILHDIGKIGVRDSVLLKKGKLTAEEYDEIKKHPDIGVKICGPLKSSQPLINIIAYHHERMDGKGYPYKIGGKDIPIEARIVAIADTFDALTSARPYREPLTAIQACHLLEEGIGKHFDEELLPEFIDIALRGELQEVMQDPVQASPPVQNLTDDFVKELDFLM
ncbi:MAG TPA: response regulator [bacterium]|nr:response regulator [bacterium]